MKTAVTERQHNPSYDQTGLPHLMSTQAIEVMLTSTHFQLLVLKICQPFNLSKTYKKTDLQINSDFLPVWLPATLLDDFQIYTYYLK